MKGDPQEQAKRVTRLVNKIRPILSGHGPDVQAMVLADLTAMWLCGHHPKVRAELHEQFVGAVMELVPENERELFGGQGFPMSGLT